MITANVIGNLGKDAETKTIGERQYIAFRMASTVKRKDGDKTTWVSVLYRFNDRLIQYLKKGTQVYVQGDMEISTYANREGQQQVDVSVFANQLVLLGQRDNANTQQPAQQPQQHYQQPAPNNQQPPQDNSLGLPF